MELFLPEEVVTNIFIRIPANQLWRLRRVCRRWKDLISTEYIRDKHLIRSKECDSSMILYEPNKNLQIKEENRLIIIDKWEQRGRIIEPIFLEGLPNFEDYSLRFDKKYICYSSDGLIVSGNAPVYKIYNPVTGETVTIDGSETRSIILALFFNPWIKEYCVILDKFCPKEFEILNLGSQPCRRPLNWSKSMGFCRIFLPPVVIDNANIYWKLYLGRCERLILSFNIETEEFSFLVHPHPNFLHGCLEDHRNMDITNIHGRLSFFQIEAAGIIDSTPIAITFNIWALLNNDWIKTHNITMDAHEFPNPRLRMISDFKVIAMENGVMLFQCNNGRSSNVYTYNLELGALRKIWEYDGVLTGVSRFFHYVPSIASLKNCESVIRLKKRETSAVAGAALHIGRHDN